MSLRDYFEQRARDGSWAALYREGPPDAKTYNFLTRRAAVLHLLAADGAFPRVLDVGCGTGDYAAVAARHGGTYHGVDFAPGMVAQAQRAHRHTALAAAPGAAPGAALGAAPAAAGSAPPPARFAVADGEALPFADDA